MRAKADGYTILMGHIGTRAFSVSLYPNLAYKPDVDFERIGVAVEMPKFIVARKDFPANDLKEFITYVKANAENLNMAHAGVGSITSTFGLLLNSLLGVKPTTVPFSGVAPAIAARGPSLSLNADGQSRDIPASDAILLRVMWPLTPAERQYLA
jgi:tripartite-type tricarboxylate transporter receptor subunit TctC